MKGGRADSGAGKRACGRTDRRAVGRAHGQTEWCRDVDEPTNVRLKGWRSAQWDIVESKRNLNGKVIGHATQEKHSANGPIDQQNIASIQSDNNTSMEIQYHRQLLPML